MKDLIKVEGLADVATNIETTLILAGLEYNMFYDPDTQTFSYSVEGPNGECYSIIAARCEED